MKVRSLLVFASAAAIPFAAAFAQNNSTPSGPQGTGWYGNISPFAAYDRNGDGVITPDEYAAATGSAVAPGAPAYSAPSSNMYNAPSAGATMAPDYNRGTDRRVLVRRDRSVLNGFSADTNPPVPPQ